VAGGQKDLRQQFSSATLPYPLTDQRSFGGQAEYERSRRYASWSMQTGEQSLPRLRDLASNDWRALLHLALHWFGKQIERLPRAFFNHRLQAVLDGLTSAASTWIAFILRYDGAVPFYAQGALWTMGALMLLLRPGFVALGTSYQGTWRYFNLRDALLLAMFALPPSALMLAARISLAGEYWFARFPITVVVMEYFLFLSLAVGLRSFRRVSFEATRPLSRRKTRALLLGTEETLPSALRQVSSIPDIGLIGLVAPEPHLKGLRIDGTPVLGDSSALSRLLAIERIDLLLIADVNLDCVGAAVSTAAELGTEVRLLPSAANVIKGQVRVHTSPRPDAVLIDRAAVEGTPHPAVLRALDGRTVLITGAGGSIGAELARQVANLPASRLVLLDQDENSIFETEGQLKRMGTKPELKSVVGSIRDMPQLRSVFETHQPDIVLHAAAYKHVPIMEVNCCEAVLNNAVGTRNLLDLTIQYGGERFVMISTDKAVKPTSVMGATKRAAELLVQFRAASGDHSTRLACVRFGNVVGSRGSVVPIFLRQIAEGGPVTVTHEDMTRYFMTIPEAVQLVLQAATLASRGDIYMLDMGDPVKITNLARKLIEMSGLRPDKDVEIRITGTRPGEKIHEQLWTVDAQVSPTELPRVFAVQREPVRENFERAFEAVAQAATERDEGLVRARLEMLGTGYARRQHSAASAH
jgi:FlaA1/EpsC-like NDP-sugar epimerase